MEFSYFTTLVREELERRTGDCYKVRLNDVTKNNGVVLRGLTVTQDDSNISPTIYLNNYYEEYMKGRATLLNVVNDVMDTYQRNKVNQSVDMRYFLDYERVKDSTDRPILNGNNNIEFITELMEKRREKYEKAADIVIYTDGKSVLQICEELIAKL